MDTLEKPFAPDRRPTLAKAVSAEIERRIVAGALPAGDKLNELALAEDLGVSRGTVREAVRILAQSGLISFVSNRGAFVRSLSVEEIAQLYDLRGAIFAAACAWAARRWAAQPDPALRAALEGNLSQMRAAHRLDDKEGYYALNIAFHGLVLEAAANPRAKDLYEGLVKEMHLFRRRGLSFASNIEKSIEEHAEIVAAILAGDPEAARRAGQGHVEHGHQRFVATLGDGEREAGP